MNLFRTYPILHHHAYVVRSTSHDAGIVLRDILAERFDVSRAHPNFSLTITEQLGINDVRSIIDEVAQIPHDISFPRCIIIACTRLTPESTNALLKSLEEPTKGTILFLVTHPSAYIPETVASRTIELYDEVAGADAGYAELVKKIFSESPARRLKTIEKFFESCKENEKSDRSEGLRILDGIEEFIAKKNDLAPYISLLSYIDETRREILSTGSSPKMLFEHLTFRIPHAYMK